MIVIVQAPAKETIASSKSVKDLYMRPRVLPAIIPTIVLAVATPLSAQHANHSGHSDHGSPGSAPAILPTEPGDGGFAAIAEIVSILVEDPDTDWSRVDIDGLRSHLVDMNQLVVGARVRSERLPDGLRLRIGTAGRAGAAASRMVPAHGPVLASETGWLSEVAHSGDEIVWTVTGNSEQGAARIQALGFFWADGNWRPPPSASSCAGPRPVRSLNE